jgi:hypothetical protein
MLALRAIHTDSKVCLRVCRHFHTRIVPLIYRQPMNGTVASTCALSARNYMNPLALTNGRVDIVKDDLAP